jgi:hypothetical protein
MKRARRGKDCGLIRVPCHRGRVTENEIELVGRLISWRWRDWFSLRSSQRNMDCRGKKILFAESLLHDAAAAGAAELGRPLGLLPWEIRQEHHEVAHRNHAD